MVPESPVKTLTAITVAFLATPYVVPATVPATWVPWPESSVVPDTAEYPRLARPPKSVCAALIPVSIILLQVSVASLQKRFDTSDYDLELKNLHCWSLAFFCAGKGKTTLNGTERGLKKSGKGNQRKEEQLLCVCSGSSRAVVDVARRSRTSCVRDRSQTPGGDARLGGERESVPNLIRLDGFNLSFKLVGGY